MLIVGEDVGRLCG